MSTLYMYGFSISYNIVISQSPNPQKRTWPTDEVINDKSNDEMLNTTTNPMFRSCIILYAYMALSSSSLVIENCQCRG